MVEKVFSNPDIYKIYVPLPDNPLKNLNCYVIKTPNKNLVIDTGFNMEECRIALHNGLKELNIDISQTELFITHLHSDHTGLVSSLLPKENNIYMGRIDFDYFSFDMLNESWEVLDNKFLAEGFPREGLIALQTTNPARNYAPDEPFDAVRLEDNDKITIGDYEFTCILTPGHTPGHMCLYLEKEKLLFTGDHVLFDITPNITFWSHVDNSLLNYLESLKKIQTFDVKVALPSHRKNDMDFYVRVKQIIKHHKERLAECVKIIKASSRGLHSYEIAGKMQWSMRGRNWEEFPMHQRWFAVGETIAHLDYLINENEIYKELRDGIYIYKKIYSL